MRTLTFSTACVALLAAAPAFSAELTLNPYPVQEAQEAPTQLAPEVVEELMARKGATARVVVPVDAPVLAPEVVEAKPVVEAELVDDLTEMLEAEIAEELAAERAVEEIAVIEEIVTPAPVAAPPVYQERDVEFYRQMAREQLAYDPMTAVAPVAEAVKNVVAPEPVVEVQPELKASVARAVPAPSVLELDRVTVTVEPAGVPVALVEKPVAQVVVRDIEKVMVPVEQEVARISASADSMPAQLQERALMRGVQGRAGDIIDTEVHQADLSEIYRFSGAGQVVPPPSEAAERLIAEADVMAEAVLPKPMGAVSAPRTKIIYNEDNVRDVMAAARPEMQGQELSVPTPMPGDVPVALLSHGADAAASPFWRADVGQDVFDVLTSWSARAGVKLVWDSPFWVQVREDVSFDGGYEAAVEALLSQYSGLRAGVSGQLYVDQSAGHKVLVIRASGQEAR